MSTSREIMLNKCDEIIKRFEKMEKSQVSRYFRDADKSIHVYPHENNATGISPSRPAAGSATMTLRQDALPAAPGQRLPSWGSSPSMAHSCDKIKKSCDKIIKSCDKIAINKKLTDYIGSV